MSNKTRARKTRTTSTAGSSRNLRSVPDQGTAAKGRTDTEDKLWAALQANPNSTATDLASEAKIGKSTAAKILARWSNEGNATRTPGIADGGRRAADLWAITTTDVGTEPTNHNPTDGHTPTDDVSASDADAADTCSETTVADAKLPDAQSADGDATEAKITEPTATETADLASVGPVAVEEAISAAGSVASEEDMAASGGGDGKAARLAPGALRGMVEDYLRDHPGEEFGPTAIAKALGGKSSGAVSNALDKLEADGTAVKTMETPKRFALAPMEQAAVSDPTS